MVIAGSAPAHALYFTGYEQIKVKDTFNRMGFSSAHTRSIGTVLYTVANESGIERTKGF